MSATDPPSLAADTPGGIPDHAEQMLGLTPTPSGLRLGDVEKENRKRGYTTGCRPKGELHTSLKRMKSRCSLGWLVTEKQ